MKQFLFSVLLLIPIALHNGCGGPRGSDGSSCTVKSITGGAMILCTDGTKTAIVNGTNFVIKPFCPTKAGYYAGAYGSLGLQEYYINDGANIYAILDAGTATAVYLTLLAPGPYQTSDGSGCRFTVSITGEITEL